MFAPIIKPTLCLELIKPALTKPIIKIMIADDELVIAVINAPINIANIGLSTTFSIIFLNLLLKPYLNDRLKY